MGDHSLDVIYLYYYVIYYTFYVYSSYVIFSYYCSSEDYGYLMWIGC